MTRRVRAGVDPDDSQVSGPGPPEWVRTLSPAAEHAVLRGHRCTAAAIHVLDGIQSAIFPREAVTMAGVDWAAIAEVRPMLSSGEQTLTDAAEDLDLVGQVGGLTLAEVRQRVDVEGNARVRDAMVMVGQAAPDPDGEYDGDRLVVEDQAREGFWDRYARGDR